MTTNWERGSRSIKFDGLPASSGATSLNVTIGYSDHSCASNGACLDSVIIPAIAELPRLLRICNALLDEYDASGSVETISDDVIDSLARAIVDIEN